MKLEIAQKILARRARRRPDAATSSRWRSPCSMRAARSRPSPPRTAPASSAPRSRPARRRARWPWGSARARWARWPPQRPHFVAAVTHAVGGMLIPVAGRRADPRRRGRARRRGRHLRRHLRQRRDGGGGRHRGRGTEGRSRSLSRPCRSFPRSRRCALGLEPVLRGRRFVQRGAAPAGPALPAAGALRRAAHGTHGRAARPARQVHPRPSRRAARCWPCTSA